jgi:hypothetical protein
MPEDQKSSSSFKVVDRRTFSEDGTVRRKTPEEEQARAETSRPAARQSSAGVQQPASSRPTAKPLSPEIPTGELADEGETGFETLVSYLSTTAMFQLGLLPGPSGERIPMDLGNARRTIDMLEVLQQKTEGNLTDDEARLLEEVLYELRMSCVELERRRAQKAK